MFVSHGCCVIDEADQHAVLVSLEEDAYWNWLLVVTNRETEAGPESPWLFVAERVKNERQSCHVRAVIV